MPQKKYRTTKYYFILTLGKHQVAIGRVGSKRITKSDKNTLDRLMGEVVSLRKSENGHRVNKGDW